MLGTLRSEWRVLYGSTSAHTRHCEPVCVAPQGHVWHCADELSQVGLVSRRTRGLAARVSVASPSCSCSVAHPTERSRARPILCALCDSLARAKRAGEAQPSTSARSTSVGARSRPPIKTDHTGATQPKRHGQHWRRLDLRSAGSWRCSRAQTEPVGPQYEPHPTRGTSACESIDQGRKVGRQSSASGAQRWHGHRNERWTAPYLRNAAVSSAGLEQGSPR